MATPISESLIECLKSFSIFIKELRQFQSEHLGPPALNAWEDELGRLRIWAANIGAHQTRQLSLDFRLKDASHIREQVVKLLQSLTQRLQDAEDVLDEIKEINDQEEAEDSADEEDPRSEILELQEIVATTINCLFQMSIFIRKPTQHDFYLRSKSADVSQFEPFDYNHVRNKFPRANDLIAKRLGTANTKRRKYLKYREKHAIKLAQGIDKIIENFDNYDDSHTSNYERGTAKTSNSGLFSETVATEYQIQNTGFDDSVSEISQTSYASTLISGGPLTIPSPPKGFQGGEAFVCPYCFYLITINGTHSWHKHVFQDLQPYICIMDTCATPDKLYTTRREWLFHTELCSQTATPGDFSFEKNNIDFDCPLCDNLIKSRDRYNRHLARHLQELALFILPRDEYDSDQNQDLEFISDTDSEIFKENQNVTQLPDDVLSSPLKASSPIGSHEDTVGKQGIEEMREEASRKMKQDSELLVAATYGDLILIESLLDAGADVNAQGGEYGNALNAASVLGRQIAVQLLLDAGADINAQGGLYGTALQTASANGHLFIVKTLLEARADVNAQSGRFGNALQAASANGYSLIVKTLLEAGADVNIQSGYYGNALQAASVYGDLEVVQILLDAGADVNAQGGYYGSALRAATISNHVEIVQLLRENGASVK